MNLLILLIIPLLSAVVLLLVKERKWIRALSLAGAFAQFILSIILLIQYRSAAAREGNRFMYFEQNHNWFPDLGIGFHIGVDGISVAMIMLTAFVALAGVLVSWNIEKMAKEFYFLLMLLSWGAYGFFMSLDLFLMFFFLEVAVIPKYLLISIWGSGNKTYSANKLALMLMGGSALILVGLLGVYFLGEQRTFDLPLLLDTYIPANVQTICFPLLFAGFGVFSALFPFHTWVPDGHSSAPTAGSMFLAGISMKLGGYGCLRVAVFLLPDGAKQYSDLIIILAAVGILYGAFATLMQKDLKYINAYSSVSHCGFVILGLGMLTTAALNGAVLQMVSHGLMTALFFAVIGMIYERTHTRYLSELGGLLKVMPFISTTLFIVGFCSLGLPGFSGFVAEMTVFVGSWQRSGLFYRIATIAACASIVVTAVYILRAVGKTVMGPLKVQFATLTDVTWNERIAAYVLIAGILIMGILPYSVTSIIEPATEFIVKRLQNN